MTQIPPQQAQPGTQLMPHRGTMILVFGILSLVCCLIFGIVAWVMGNSDLQAMQSGIMDRSGEGMTKAGKICGIVGIVLQGLYLLINIVLMILGIGMAGLSSTGGP